MLAPGPAQGRARTRSTRSRRSPRGWVSCSAPRSPSPPTPSASRRRPPSTRSATATSLLLENLRFNAGETSKDDAERGAFAAQLAAFGDVYVDDAFGAVHRKHACVYDVAGAAAALRRRPGAGASSRCCGRLTARPGAPVRRGARRGQGLRQARRDRGAAAQGRRAARRRRHVLHLPQGPGLRGGRLAARRRPGRHLPGPARPVRRQDRAADRHRGGRRRSPATPNVRTVAGRRDPGRLEGPGHRAGDGRGVRRGARRRPDGVLERSDGRVRAGAVRGRHPRRGRGDHQGRRLHRGRRRRLGGCRARAGPRRDAPSGTSPPAAVRRWSTSRARRCPASRRWRTEWPPHRPSPAVDGRQLEDEPQPPRGHRADPEAGVQPHREAARRRRGGGAAAVRRHPQRADRWSTATSC